MQRGHEERRRLDYLWTRRGQKEAAMTGDTDDELLDAARRLVDDASAALIALTRTDSGHPRADAGLDEFGAAIHKVARELNEWLRVYESDWEEGVRQRGLDRQQPEN
jgi:hypothetical protein